MLVWYVDVKSEYEREKSDLESVVFNLQDKFVNAVTQSLCILESSEVMIQGRR